MSSNFFAMVERMKLIDRWALMNNTGKENIAEHSHTVAVIAHALALIGNKKFGRSYNAERCALLALYHDTTEVITGDMPTPVKYYNDTIRRAYKEIEATAGDRLLAMLPEEFRPDYDPCFHPNPADKELWQLVKAADKISALITVWATGSLRWLCVPRRPRWRPLTCRRWPTSGKNLCPPTT